MKCKMDPSFDIYNKTCYNYNNKVKLTYVKIITMSCGDVKISLISSKEGEDQVFSCDSNQIHSSIVKRMRICYSENCIPYDRCVTDDSTLHEMSRRRRQTEIGERDLGTVITLSPKTGLVKGLELIKFKPVTNVVMTKDPKLGDDEYTRVM